MRIILFIIYSFVIFKTYGFSDEKMQEAKSSKVISVKDLEELESQIEGFSLFKKKNSKYWHKLNCAILLSGLDAIALLKDQNFNKNDLPSIDMLGSPTEEEQKINEKKKQYIEFQVLVWRLQRVWTERLQYQIQVRYTDAQGYGEMRELIKQFVSDEKERERLETVLFPKSEAFGERKVIY